MKVASKYGAEVFLKRFPQLADDKAEKVKAIQDEFDKFEHFETIKYALQSDEFIKYCYNRNLKYRDF